MQDIGAQGPDCRQFNFLTCKNTYFRRSAVYFDILTPLTSVLFLIVLALSPGVSQAFAPNCLFRRSTIHFSSGQRPIQVGSHGAARFRWIATTYSPVLGFLSLESCASQLLRFSGQAHIFSEMARRLPTQRVMSTVAKHGGSYTAPSAQAAHGREQGQFKPGWKPETARASREVDGGVIARIKVCSIMHTFRQYGGSESPPSPILRFPAFPSAFSDCNFNRDEALQQVSSVQTYLNSSNSEVKFGPWIHSVVTSLSRSHTRTFEIPSIRKDFQRLPLHGSHQERQSRPCFCRNWKSAKKQGRCHRSQRRLLG